jgi:sensor histidine kinase YesM
MSFGKKIKTIKSYLIHTNILFIFIPVVVVFVFLIYSIFVNSRVDVYTQKLSLVEQYCANLEGLQSDILYMSNTIYLDDEVNRILSTKEFSDDYAYLSSSQTIINTMTVITNAVYSKNYLMNILTFNGYSYFQNAVGGHSVYVDINEMQTEPWFREVEKGNGTICYLSTVSSPSLSKAFPEVSAFACRLLKNLNSGRNIGVLLIGIFEATILEEVRDVQSEDSSQLFLLDTQGMVFASNKDLFSGVDMTKSPYYEKFSKYEKGYFPATVEDLPVQVFFDTDEASGWKVASIYPKDAAWPRYLLQVTLIAFIFLALTIIKTTYNANYLSVRMHRIITEIGLLDTQNLKKRIKESDEEEFNEFIHSFNRMLGKIEELISDLEKNEREKRDLEIEALQAQINPHFLYNTIASIRFMIQMGEYDGADSALLALVKLLRNEFSDTRKIIPLKDEFAMLTQYMTVMQYRYQDTFTYTMDLCENLEQYGIIRFALQPIVENSISHGFNRKDTLGHIHIKAVEQGSDILLTVEDDGVGCDEEKINQIIASSKKYVTCERFSGIGIQNVQQRLRKDFGKPYGMEAFANDFGGLTVQLLIPKIIMEGSR